MRSTLTTKSREVLAKVARGAPLEPDDVSVVRPLVQSGYLKVTYSVTEKARATLGRVDTEKPRRSRKAADFDIDGLDQAWFKDRITKPARS